MSEPTERSEIFKELKDSLLYTFNEHLDVIHRSIQLEQNQEVIAKLFKAKEKTLESFLMFMKALNRSENKN
jgi:hypothetical protein